MEKLTREIKETTEQHSVLEAISALNASGKKALAWPKLDEEVMKNGGYYYSGLLIVYAAVGKHLGPVVDFDGVLFEVPKKFQSTPSENALIISHEHLVVKDSKISVKRGHEKNVQVVKMHRKNGWFAVNDLGFPNGEEKSSGDSAARYFWQKSDAYVGLLARGGDFFGFGIVFFDDRRDVDALLRPSGRLGVLLE